MKKIMSGAAAMLFVLASVGAAAAAGDFIPPFDGQHKIIAKSEAYYSGGVGITERNQMADMTQNFNLKLIFDTPTGAYLSAIAVKIQDAKGHVLIDTVSQGPWFSARLPAARYRIVTSFGNRRYTREINLAKKAQTLVLSWTVS